MTPETYRLIHVLGLIVLLLGLGGVLATAGPGQKPNRVFLMLHGLGALAVLVGGIGFAHKSGLGMPAWVWTKLGGWLVLGAMPTLVGRGLMPRGAALIVVLAIGAAAAWLGVAVTKPF